MYHTQSETWTEEQPAWFQELPEEQVQEISLVAAVYQDVRITRNLLKEPLVRLIIEGENLSVTLVLEIPRGYPNEKCVKVSFRSVKASSEVLQDIQSKVQAEAEQQFVTGTFALMTLLGRASELVSNLPLALQAEAFCCCVQCNARLMRQQQQKAIQAARLLEEKSPEGGSYVECLHCNARDAIYIPAATLNIAADCSYCMCEDNPLLKFECGCRCCTTCWKTFADIATGSNNLRRHTRTKRWGVGCPNHATVAITDGGLLKLCESRSYLRFNRFALEKFLETVPGSYCCPQPGCNAVAIVSDVSGGLMKCKGCRRYSCTKCFALPLDCRCEELPASTPQRRQNQLAVATQFADPPKPEAAAPTTIQVMLWWQRERKVINLTTRDPNWYTALLREMDMDPLTPKEADNGPLFVFCGIPLSQRRVPADYGVYNGCLLYAVEFVPQLETKDRREELELWSFRRSVGSVGGGGPGDGALVALDSKTKKSVFKTCPYCNVPTIHYRNHGCHHIGAYGRCCDKDWCFACRGPWPCEKGCTLFCSDKCDCAACPECVPKYPCVHCSGCDQCQIAHGEVAIFE